MCSTIYCMLKTIERKCLNCNNLFQAPLKEVNRGNGKFCSIKCGAAFNAKSKIKSPNVECAWCKKPFLMGRYKMARSKSGLYFCSRKHKDVAQRLGGIEAIQPDHYGTNSNYRKKALRQLPNVCSGCGYNRFVQALQVHHKDHNRSNNDISNLEILCPTCHWEHHLGLR